MLNPIGLNSIETPKQKEDVLYIAQDEIPEFDIEDYDLLDEKDFKSYITDIERICRTSREYRKMIRFLKENMDMTKCGIFENVSNADTYKIKIEIHHSPFGLADLVSIVYRKRLSLGQDLDAESIAKETMYLHYCCLVGLIPLSQTVHELVHNKYIFVPMNKVFGKVEEFYNLYRPYLSPEQIDTYERIKEYTEKYNDSMDYNRVVLDKAYMYIDMDGNNSVYRLNNVILDMDNRISEIRGEQVSTNSTFNAEQGIGTIEIMRKMSDDEVFDENKLYYE